MATTTTAASKKRKLTAKPKTKPKAPRKVAHIAIAQWDDDADYSVLHKHLSGIVSQIKSPLFTTDVEHLWGAFYGALPAERRQHYNCRTCRKFVERFGGLVAIVGDNAVPVFWPQNLGAPYFDAAILAARRHVEKARINGVFLCEDKVWGVESTRHDKAPRPPGSWQHMHTVPRRDQVYKPTALVNASQAMAEKREEYGMLCRGLAEFPIEMVRKTHALLTTGGLYRSEKCIGAAEWLLKLHEAREATRNTRTKENVTWAAVASAPAGWCHVRTSMIGTLLEDVQAGKSAAEIKWSFDAKMSPLQYQRPSAAPTDGQLAAAEKVIEKLAAADALDRRYARLEDVIQYAFWTPKVAADKPTGGVFGHLRHASQISAVVDMPAQVSTWVKFARDVLPTAERIEYKTTYAAAGFFAFVTATNPDAPPILQWDTEAKRNPVNWYLYHGGSSAMHWNLTIGYVDVTAITTQPSEWGKPLEHQGRGAYLILNGARDTHPAQAGLALFPEVLKSEFHGIRASLEALSRSRKLGGALEASACGVCVQDKATGQIVELRVTSRGVRSTYRVDRFE